MKEYQAREQVLRDQQATYYEQLYHRIYGPNLDFRERDIFATAVKKGRFHYALELGCGTGRITETVAPCVGTLLALDLSWPSLEELRAKRLSNVICQRANAAEGLPFRSESFDLVLSCGVLHHMVLGDLLNAMKESSRVLKPSGQMIFSVYNFDFLLCKQVFECVEDSGLYCKRFSRGYVAYLARQAGFAVKTIRYYRALPSRFQHAPLSKWIMGVDKLLSSMSVVGRLLSVYMFCILQKVAS